MQLDDLDLRARRGEARRRGPRRTPRPAPGRAAAGRPVRRTAPPGRTRPTDSPRRSPGRTPSGRGASRACPVDATASGVFSSPIVPCPLIDGAAAIAAPICSAVVPSACQSMIAACISGNTSAKAVDSYVALSRRTAAGPRGTAPSRGRAAAGPTYAAVSPPSECPTIDRRPADDLLEHGLGVAGEVVDAGSEPGARSELPVAPEVEAVAGGAPGSSGTRKSYVADRPADPVQEQHGWTVLRTIDGDLRARPRRCRCACRVLARTADALCRPGSLPGDLCGDNAQDLASDQRWRTAMSATKRTAPSGAQRRAASCRHVVDEPGRASAPARPARGRAARRAGTARCGRRASAPRARTVTAHILNSSAAAPWTMALRP